MQPVSWDHEEKSMDTEKEPLGSPSGDSVDLVAEPGDHVRIHYICRLDDGTVFATTYNKEPLEFVIGTTRIIPGLQEAVVGMRVGEKKTQVIPPEKAYGPYHEEMVATIDRSLIPPGLEVQVGTCLRVEHADGHLSDVIVTEVGTETITVDGNHPLAGKRLTMEIQLVGLEKARRPHR